MALIAFSFGSGQGSCYTFGDIIIDLNTEKTGIPGIFHYFMENADVTAMPGSTDIVGPVLRHTPETGK
jgi:hypothetical protein